MIVLCLSQFLKGLIGFPGLQGEPGTFYSSVNRKADLSATVKQFIIELNRQ